MNMTNTADLETYINKRNISQATKDNYFYTFNRVSSIVPYETIFGTLPIDELEQVLKKSDINKGVVLKFLIILSKIREADADLLRLIEHYTFITNKATDTKTISIKDTSLTFNELKEDLLNTKSNQAYTLKYILLTYGTRNMDLISTITYDNKIFHEVMNGTRKVNIFYITDKRVLFIRNSYKTYEKWGTLTYEIEDDRFNYIIRQKKEGEAFLLTNVGSVLQSKQLSTYIKRLYDKQTKINMNEGVIYKIIIHHYKDDAEMRKKYSLSRPHNQSTQLKTYTP